MKRKPIPLIVDAVLVFVFIFIGTRNHDTADDAAGVISAAAPFLVALGIAWLATRAWKAPTALSTGVGIWIITVAGGMLLRRFVWDDGTAGAFIIVAAIFNAFTLVGWRVVRENLISRRQS